MPPLFPKSHNFIMQDFQVLARQFVGIGDTRSCTERMNTRFDGSCTPRMYVGAGICRSRATSSLVEDIRKLMLGFVAAVAFA
jgi:hypothetical protein